MDVEHVLALACDGGVEGLGDLGGDDGTGHGADGFGDVVGEGEFVLVGERAELEEVVVGGEGDAGVVDLGHVEEIEDGIGIFEGGLICGKGAVDEGVHGGVERSGAVEGLVILCACKVVVRADCGCDVRGEVRKVIFVL